MVAGPVSAVLAAVEAGTPCLQQVASSTGLPEDVVRAATEHLVRLGRLRTQVLNASCPPEGCGGCTVRVACHSEQPEGTGSRPGRVLALSVVAPRG